MQQVECAYRKENQCIKQNKLYITQKKAKLSMSILRMCVIQAIASFAFLCVICNITHFIISGVIGAPHTAPITPPLVNNCSILYRLLVLEELNFGKARAVQNCNYFKTAFKRTRSQNYIKYFSIKMLGLATTSQTIAGVVPIRF